MKNPIQIFALVLLGVLVSCKFDASTEVTIYSEESQAEKSPDPRISIARIEPTGDSIHVLVRVWSGSNDAAFVDRGLFRLNGGTWDTLQLNTDSLSSGNYLLQGQWGFQSDSSDLAIDLIIIDQFDKRDSLMGQTIPSTGAEFMRSYTCSDPDGCMVQRALEL